jgi:hypothetical protein
MQAEQGEFLLPRFDPYQFRYGRFAQALKNSQDTLDKSKLIPWIQDDYLPTLAKRAANAFKYDINDPVFRANPAYQ